MYVATWLRYQWVLSEVFIGHSYICLVFLICNFYLFFFGGGGVYWFLSFVVN